jgi:regulatory protein
MTYRITHIEHQKKDKGRVNLYLDGAFAFGLSEEVVLKHHLNEGDEIEESTINDVLLFEEIIKAKQKALSLLSYRARSVDELKKRLKDKGFSEQIIIFVVKDFLRVGLLNDKEFASSYAQTRMIQKPMSKELLFKELAAKGIDEETALQTINAAYGEKTEYDVARDLIKKKKNKIYTNEKNIEKKISDFLFRRGFKWEVISSVIQETFH